MYKSSSTFRMKIFVAFGSLLIIKMAFLGAAVLLDSEPVGLSTAHAQAPAKETGKKENPQDQRVPLGGAESAPDSGAPSPSKSPGPGELDLEIISDVQRRNKELDLKEEELKREQERVSAMKADLDRQISELKALQARIDEQITLRNDLQKEAIKKLAKTYAAMPPENAAALIQRIDTSIAIRVLGAMKERSAGRILAVIPPKLASALSEGLVKK